MEFISQLPVIWMLVFHRMTPRIGTYALWTFLLCPLIFYPLTGFSQNSANDSLAILAKDSLAYHLFLSKPDSSIALAGEALRDAKEKDSRFLMGWSEYVLSKAYWTKANYKLSAEYGFNALRLFENTSHIEQWGYCLLSLGRTFTDLHNFEQANLYIERALALAQLHQHEKLLAEAFREKSMLLSENMQYDSALVYSDKGIFLFEKLKDSLSLSILYSRKAKIYFHQGKFEMSRHYNQKALAFDLLLENARALGISYYQCAVDAYQANKYDSAILLLNKSIPVSESVHNTGSLIRSHEMLANIFEKLGRQNEAIAELKLAGLYKDSLYNTEKSGQIQEMQSLYELAVKEKTITSLEEENQFKEQEVILERLLVGLLLLFVVFLGAVIFLQQRYRKLQQKTNEELAFKNKSIEQQKEEIESQAETLQQLNNLKTKLFSVISHDLRNPLANLHSLLDLLLKKNLSEEEFIVISRKLKSSLDITQRTLENLLSWSLSQMEGLKTYPRIIELKQTIHDTCALLAEAAESKNVLVATNIEDDLFVRADEDQLYLILRNLIHNAIKFSKPYESIVVSALSKNNICLISVKDTGIGMTKSEVEMIISARHHFSKTGTMQEKGTGLGLILCQEFIKLNGGDLNIESSLNQGTEIIFTLPLSPITTRSEAVVP